MRTSIDIHESRIKLLEQAMEAALNRIERLEDKLVELSGVESADDL